MSKLSFYHLFANGDDSVNFIVSHGDFVYQFNLVAICSYKTGVKVAAFSIEETHPHFLLYGDDDGVSAFMEMYKRSTIRHVSATRGSADGVVLDLVCCEIDNQNYLMNVASYVVVQSTKDGKPVMFYDYKWGSGSLYFRSGKHIPIWQIGDSGGLKDVRRLADLNSRERVAVCGRHLLPEDWFVCDNLILPTNYVDVDMFEGIFRTHNCFRVFVGGSNKQYDHVRESMASARGVELNDYEARELLSRFCSEHYHTRDVRRLDAASRLHLALALKNQYGMSCRQLAAICRLPESELKKYYK